MTGTDTLRKLVRKFNDFWYLQIGEIKVAKWRQYFPSIYYNKSLNNLTFSFYDCSYTSKHVLTPKHFLDLHINNHPKITWLSWCGFTFWFPYTFDEIRYEFKQRVMHGDELKQFRELHRKIDDELSDLKYEAKELVYYADTAAKILRENGFEGKAEALESRMSKVAKRLGMEGFKKTRKKPTPKTVEVKKDE